VAFEVGAAAALAAGTSRGVEIPGKEKGPEIIRALERWWRRRELNLKSANI
jgi:hypothetical protein